MSSIAVDLTDDVKSRSAASAAAKLEHLSGDTMAHELMQLSPGLAQDVLAELPNEARERAIAAAPADVARQWQRNALYDAGTVGRLRSASRPASAAATRRQAMTRSVGSSCATLGWLTVGSRRHGDGRRTRSRRASPTWRRHSPTPDCSR